MSRTADVKSRNHAPDQRPTQSLDLGALSLVPEESSPTSRLQFYQDYRDAVRELREGRPEKFLAFQKDPRIHPTAESLQPPARAKGYTQSTTVEPATVLIEAQSSITSLLSSVKGLVGALATFIK